MQHETHFAADKVRSEAHQCWRNATAMYCHASTARDADTRALYVQIAVCWAALARELEKRLALAYREQPSRHYTMDADDRWPTATANQPSSPPPIRGRDRSPTA